MSDRDSIEAALQRVQTGELSPAEATQMLLAEQLDASQPSQTSESLTSLVDRLGQPPNDIATAWCQQAKAIANRHERKTNQGLPKFEPEDWSIDRLGALVWNGLSFDSDDTTPAQELTSASLNHLEEFRQTFGQNSLDNSFSPSLVADPKDVTATEADAPEHSSPSTSQTDDEPTTKRANRRVKQVMIAAGVLLCATAAGLILYDAAPREVAESQTAPSQNPAASIFSPGVATLESDASNNQTPSTEPFGSDLETLETLESMSESEISELEAQAESEPTFSLDDLMPATAEFVPRPSLTPKAEIEPVNPESPEPESPESGAADPPASIEEALDAGTAEPDESPQETRTSDIAVQLPEVDSGESTRLAKTALTDLRLEFPFDVPLQLKAGEQEIRDTRKDVLVASISANSDGTELSWSDTATESASVSTLAHGRIKPGGGGTIFLRPTVQAEPWPIRLDQPDVMPTWNLRHAIPPRVTHLDLDFGLPDDVELGWIEPIESESIRRTRALAVLTPKDGETVSLGVRFDIRCSRKLSVRVRYAARLDSTLPWQVVSNSLLDQLANQLTQQATLVSNEATRLDRVASMAGSTGRRLLRIKQDRNDERGELIRSASLRVAQLQSMIAGLEAEGTLNLRVYVQWPDTQQVLLSTQAENNR